MAVDANVVDHYCGIWVMRNERAKDMQPWTGYDLLEAFELVALEY